MIFFFHFLTFWLQQQSAQMIPLFFLIPDSSWLCVCVCVISIWSFAMQAKYNKEASFLFCCISFLVLDGAGYIDSEVYLLFFAILLWIWNRHNCGLVVFLIPKSLYLLYYFKEKRNAEIVTTEPQKMILELAVEVKHKTGLFPQKCTIYIEFENAKRNFFYHRKNDKFITDFSDWCFFFLSFLIPADSKIYKQAI